MGKIALLLSHYNQSNIFFDVRRAQHPPSLITPVLWPRGTWRGRAQAEKGRERIPAKVVDPKPRNLSRGQIRRPRYDKEKNILGLQYPVLKQGHHPRRLA